MRTRPALHRGLRECATESTLTDRSVKCSQRELTPMTSSRFFFSAAFSPYSSLFHDLAWLPSIHKSYGDKFGHARGSRNLAEVRGDARARTRLLVQGPSVKRRVQVVGVVRRLLWGARGRGWQ